MTSRACGQGLLHAFTKVQVIAAAARPFRARESFRQSEYDLMWCARSSTGGVLLVGTCNCQTNEHLKHML